MVAPCSDPVPVETLESHLLCTLEALPLLFLLTLLALLEVLIKALLLLSKGLQSCIALVINDELHCLLPAPVTSHTFGSQQLLKSILSFFLRTASCV